MSPELLARDLIWGEDTTHLGRTPEGLKVEGEVVKDWATLQTVGLAVGDVPTAKDVLALLEQTARERGGFPLIWASDRGSINLEGNVQRLLAREHVVHLSSRVHTPTDNGATEHQHQELKAQSGLGKGVRIDDVEEARARLEAARETLDEGRLRATRGWRTAAEVSRALPRADACVDRNAFYVAACTAMDDAENGKGNERARIAARRQALLDTLVSLGLAIRHVGPRPRIRPGPPLCTAPPGLLDCAGARA